jgi:hypothetical protein
MNEHPELYNIAKRITLEAGFQWTDPRTGKTHFPPRTRRKTTNKRKKQHEKKP